MRTYITQQSTYEALIERVTKLEKSLFNNNDDETATIINNECLTDGSIGLKYNVCETHADCTGIGENSDSSLEIGSTVNGVPVTSIAESAFVDCKNITEIIIPRSITSIKPFAFFGCTNLQTVYYTGTEEEWRSMEVAAGNTRLENAAIYYYSNNIPNVVGRYWYYDSGYTAKVWENVDETEADIESVIKYKLEADNTSYTVVGINTENNIDVVIPAYYNNLPVTRISPYAFQYCSNITSIELGSNISNIGTQAFMGCPRITAVRIPASVTNVGNKAFCYCTGLIDITVDENNPNYMSIDGNLYNKTGTTLIQYAIGKTNIEVNLPNNITSIGNGAFQSCQRLKSIILPNSVTSIGTAAFYNCPQLASVIMPEGITYIGDSAFYHCKALKSITIPDSVTSIGSSAFSGCTTLASVKLSKNITCINDHTFYECTNLMSINIPEGVTTIDQYAFYRCEELISITIPSSMVYIEYATFFNCMSLYYVTNNSSLTYRIMPEGSNDGLTQFARVLIDKYGNISYSNNAEYTLTEDQFLFSYSNNTYRLLAYLGEESSITLPTNINGNSYTIDRFFLKNPASVIIPNGAIQTVDSSAFMGCNNLTSITIPEGVTSIGSFAFYGGINLTSIVIPSSVTKIGNWAFYYCRNLTDIYYTGTEGDWANIDIKTVAGDDVLYNATIHYNSEV